MGIFISSNNNNNSSINNKCEETYIPVNNILKNKKFTETAIEEIRNKLQVL